MPGKHHSLLLILFSSTAPFFLLSLLKCLQSTLYSLPHPIQIFCPNKKNTNFCECQNSVLIPIAILINYHKLSSLRQHKCILLVWRSEAQHEPYRAKRCACRTCSFSNLFLDSSPSRNCWEVLVPGHIAPTPVFVIASPSPSLVLLSPSNNSCDYM